MAEEGYDALDRATMATWRASNFLGWGAVALGSAVVLHTVFDELKRRIRISGWFGTLNDRPLPNYVTWQSIAPSYGYKALVAIVVGVLIGWIAGAKVWKSQVRVAAGLAGAYVLISMLVLEHGYHIVTATSPDGITTVVPTPRHGLPSSGLEWSYSLLALFAIPVAALVAWLVAKRRSPAPLSQGSRESTLPRAAS